MAKYDILCKELQGLLSDLRVHGTWSRIPATPEDRKSTKKALILAWLVAIEDADGIGEILGRPGFDPEELVNETKGE